MVAPSGSTGPKLDHLVEDNLDDHLSRGDAAHYLGPNCFGSHRGDEVLDHRQGHIGFQQRHAHLAHGRRNIAFGEAAVAHQLVESGA